MEGGVQVKCSGGGELGRFGCTVRSRSVESSDVNERAAGYGLERAGERWLMGILL